MNRFLKAVIQKQKGRKIMQSDHDKKYSDLPTDTFEYSEGFCLMEYYADDGLCRCNIWNSRDGVTPFIVHCPIKNKECSHTNSGNDLRISNYTPYPGQLVFIDLTDAKLCEYKTRQIEAQWKDNMETRFSSKEEALELLTKDAYQEGAPDVMIAGFDEDELKKLKDKLRSFKFTINWWGQDLRYKAPEQLDSNYVVALWEDLDKILQKIDE